MNLPDKHAYMVARICTYPVLELQYKTNYACIMDAKRRSAVIHQFGALCFQSFVCAALRYDMKLPDKRACVFGCMHLHTPMLELQYSMRIMDAKHRSAGSISGLSFVSCML
jgi:hypothetical protein